MHNKFLEDYKQAIDSNLKKQRLDTFEQSARDIISEKIKACDTSLSAKKLIFLEQEFCKIFGLDDRVSRFSIRNSRNSRLG